MTNKSITSALPPGWAQQIGNELQRQYMQQLRQFLKTEKQAGKVIYPRSTDVFNAYHLTEFDQVKVVILGQDPYHGPNQAHGLCFSVREGIPTPPSLQNIFKELNQDLDLEIPNHGHLTAWAEQGVLLLNAVLTVQQAQAGSHADKGWETFTDVTIRQLSEHRRHLVFLLWGSYAQKKGRLINRQNHLVLEAPHPSPLSAHRGFFGCKHFSKANDYLLSHQQMPINWQL